MCKIICVYIYKKKKARPVHRALSRSSGPHQPKISPWAALKLAHEDAIMTFLAHTRNAEEM